MLSAPFPYFGGKARIASEVWARLGNVDGYIEPFFGSGAVLLGRPGEDWGTETVNDFDGMISNFWRAVQHDPEAVAHYADWPVNENDLHARHAWLLGQKQSLQARLEGDPDYYDARISGWWVWGISCWIGSGWCAGVGPWHVVGGELVNSTDNVAGIWRKIPHLSPGGKGVNRQRPHLSTDCQGVKRQRPHLSTDCQGVNRQIPHLGHGGKGVNRKRPHLGNGYTDGCGINKPTAGNLVDWFSHLQARLRRVRVCCGDWSRITGTTAMGLDRFASIGVFLDPPYAADQGRDMGLYTCDSGTVAYDVREWAISMAQNPKVKIALCGYEGIVMPDDWSMLEWSAAAGYQNQGDGSNKNNRRERIWFSPACIRIEQGRLI